MRWFNGLRIKTRLVAVAALSAILTAVVCLISVNGMRHQAAVTDDLLRDDVALLMVTKDLRADLNDVGRHYRTAMLNPATQAGLKGAQDCEKALESSAERIKTMQAAKLTPAEKVFADKVTGIFPGWREDAMSMCRHCIAGDLEGALKVMAGNRTAAGDMRGALNDLTKELENGIKLKIASARAAQQRAQSLLLLLGMLSAVFGLTLSVLMAQTVSRPLAESVRVLEGMAAGDFTRRLTIHSADELGKMSAALNTALEHISDSLRDVSAAAHSVASASEELSASSGQISSGAQAQASSLEETAASLEEITSTVKQNADSAHQATELAKGASDVAQKGGGVVGSAVSAMSEINESSKKIAEIITTIDEIAFQTNLLALNAAVEAARAGEQGRGFAVVAGEVRNLAQRSASAAKEIKTLIQDSVHKVEAGSALVNQSGATLQEIVTSVKRVTDIVSEIAVASREQSTGIGQVGVAVSQMDAVTQSNAAQTEELAGTAESLSAQAEELQALVGRFQLAGEPARVRAAAVVKHAAAHAPLKLVKKHAAPAAAPAPAPVAAKTGTDDGFQEF